MREATCFMEIQFGAGDEFNACALKAYQLGKMLGVHIVQGE